MEPQVLYETDVLGTAYTTVDEKYAGPCALECQSGSGRRIPRVVFPNADEAYAAARFAVGALGGYLRATVHAAQGATPTHPTWDAWAFE